MRFPMNTDHAQHAHRDRTHRGEHEYCFASWLTARKYRPAARRRARTRGEHETQESLSRRATTDVEEEWGVQKYSQQPPRPTSARRLLTIACPCRCSGAPRPQQRIWQSRRSSANDVRSLQSETTQVPYAITSCVHIPEPIHAKTKVHTVVVMVRSAFVPVVRTAKAWAAAAADEVDCEMHSLL